MGKNAKNANLCFAAQTLLKCLQCWLCSSKHNSTNQASKETWNLARSHFRQVTDSRESHLSAFVFPMDHSTMTHRIVGRMSLNRGP